MARQPVPGDDRDTSRREFFRTVTRQTVHGAGAVMDVATDFQRARNAAARELFEPLPPATDEQAPTFRSAYRHAGDAIIVLDQRQLPERVETYELREPTEIASAIRSGAVTPGPVVAELAAFGVALAARRAAGRDAAGREQLMRAAFGTLRATRPDVRAIGAAVDRMESRHDILASSGASASDVADALMAEADLIAGEAAAAHAQIGRDAAAALQDATQASTGVPEINVLAHGDAGPLSCGLVGMATTCFRTLLDSGVGLHVWLTECAPSGEGRICAHQLAQSDIPHTVIPDTTVGWLLANRQIDAALLRGDAIAGNGDVAALIGALQVTQLAHGAGVQVVVLAPGMSVDPALADLSDLLPASALPVADIVPAALVSRTITEQEH